MSEVEDPRRRDFINIAAVAWIGVGGVSPCCPCSTQMNPSADVLAQSTTEIDLAKIQPGQAIKTSFRKQPLFVRNLTPKEIAEADAVPVSELRDPRDAGAAHQGRPQELADHAGRVHPSRLQCRSVRARARIAVLSAAISARATVRPTTPPARIRKGPAPKNLAVPDYKFTSGHHRNGRLRTHAMSFPWAKHYAPTHPLMKWVDERLPVPRLVYNAVGAGYPVPRNLNYFWNFGVLAGAALGIQIITGIVLAMHYGATADGAFNSVEHIMRDVNGGWLLRYAHANGAAMFFIVVYIHVFRGLYYGSYKAPREMVWLLGVVIFLLMMATAFMGYVLPWGQMSFWGRR